MAVSARNASGKMRNNQTVNSSGYVVTKPSSTSSTSSSSASGTSSRSRSSSSKTSNNITASIKDNLSLKPLTASASSNHPLINGNQIAEKDTNKISSSEVGDGVFSFISGAASGVAASLSMGLSDIFVVKDDNKNETVYLVGRLVGAVVVAVVAVAVTVGSGAAAVGTSPTVVGSAVSVGSAVNAGGKVVSAVGVAGDAVSTIIANGSGSSGGGGEIKNVYSSIKNAPKYPEDFQVMQNGTEKVNIKDRQLIKELREIESGNWKKVYKDGYANGEKVSIHYFESPSGKVFDVDVHKGVE